jgi:8-oxo-dGTP diphosphatase
VTAGPAPAGPAPGEPADTAERAATAPLAARHQRIAAYGIAADAEGRLLLVRAASYLTVAGRWFLPGGGVEHGETPDDALRREIAEETGLVVGASTLLGVLSDTWPIPGGTDLHTLRLVYRVEQWSGTLRPEVSGSSDAAAWFSPAELETLPVMHYVREALSRFAA